MLWWSESTSIGRIGSEGSGEGISGPFIAWRWDGFVGFLLGGVWVRPNAQIVHATASSVSSFFQDVKSRDLNRICKNRGRNQSASTTLQPRHRRGDSCRVSFPEKASVGGKPESPLELHGRAQPTSLLHAQVAQQCNVISVNAPKHLVKELSGTTIKFENYAM